MINVSQLNQRYGGSQILWDLNMDIAAGSRTCIMGRNGVGKTTLLKCLMGMLPAASGSITINQQDVTRASIESRANIGVGYVPQGRHIFGQLTVEENLKVSLNCKRQTSRSLPEDIFEYFPVLKEMLQRRGGDLSGGQQQQLAIARALVLNPNMLILDEPNEGIQPNIVQLIRDVLLRLNKEKGMTIVLVEQKLPFARAVGEQFYLMERGKVVSHGAMPELNDDLVKQYLSV
ncbi:MAG TPA: urea ABC transporter ATP-binding subunit UrtE [Alteromonas australica]|jgi:urea transport system ATP-binding protein|uniref:Urea ABC transporter ATP-binding protein n=1 Tax=Alteromonas australica TaxID=589873 RepID=A0A075NS65_9ALTE|nr:MULTISPECIES: urea ABC transporter ATP-binding subunit UrtE [Alteromonas]MBU32950.1 urea ABC transporter ATP-binding subunit UrtE [Alteromonas sp.]AIF97349.1 urea ABC transporter ATP-binding protein [Alteromonas australica]QPL50240.1 urea ABC transporter ATP-binding subunit UrtE [Alteromonas sp. B31-7]HAI70731.1 urea ABC transporter ATP-binding subunit UrtE [Alteromonas australica]HAU26416.1 urea ABC transporter ATP-binding subunit UrtE [Alteromonas australica]|tara:strand:- start:22233 stop:22928 length:696 start_codon:yes stop_codon:yes gene_type:complete